MSRIHEALKRAEAEQAAQSNRVGLSKPPTEAPLSLVGSEESAPALGATSRASQIAFAEWSAKCRQAAWSPDTKTMLFFGPDEQAQGTEQFRALRSRLYQVRERQPLKKVLVTSALPKEGKSFIAANLAQALVRQQGQRALLVDADLRAARLHATLGTAASPGLSEYLMHQEDEFRVIQQGPMENLFFLPSGREVSNPAELLAGGGLKSLLERLEPLFDWIIIDSPPAVPVTDASLLAKCCDGILLVVRSSVTPFDLAQKARLEFSDEQLLGVVLNGVGSDSMPYHRYYYSTYPRGDGKAAQR
ncbi:MAG TPA: CpsD/CapB family tyrosine-protein kinase [Terriglobales bacterium]|jgi:protein-tyrosine kinase|nr:CpsD/CapB family tyrosine-protein kinase [Terriglobales bacterium]